MLLPSRYLWNKLANEKVGLFFEKTVDEYGNAIIIKLPSNGIKSLFIGSKAEIYFFIININNHYVLCSSIVVHDDEVSPLCIFSPHHNKEEVSYLKESYSSTSLPIHIYNELSLNVASGFTNINAIEDGNFFKDDIKFYEGNNYEISNLALDAVQNYFDNIQRNNTIAHDVKIINVSHCELNITELAFNTISICGHNETKTYEIMCDNEGLYLENCIWALLNNSFSPTLYHSPYYNNKNLKKELTDLLALSQHGIILFESKVSAIIASDKNRKTSRKQKSLEKQIIKAISQLSGAISTIKSGEKIYDNTGKEIKIDLYHTKHMISVIIISDFFPGVDWRLIAKKLINASIKCKACFTILDLMEFRTLIGAGELPELIMLNLYNIFETMANEGTSFIRGMYRPPNNPT